MSVIKKISFQLLVQCLGIVTGFITSIIAARILGVEGRGMFSVFSTSLNFLIILLGFGINFSVLYYLSSNKLPTQRLYNSSILICLLLTVFFLLIVLIEQLTGSNFFTEISSVNEKFLMIILFSQNLFNGVFSSFLVGLKNIRSQQISSLIFYFFNAVLHGVFFVFVYKFPFYKTYFNFLVFYTIVVIISLLINFYFFQKCFRIRFSFTFLSKNEFKLLFAFAGFAYLANVFQYFNYKIDNYFLVNFCTLTDLGIYSLGFNLFKMLWVFPMAISTVLTPLQSELKLEPATENTLKVSRVFIFFAIPFILIFSPFVGYFINIFYGNEFYGSAEVLLLLFVIGFIPIAISNLLLSFFNSRGMAKYNFIYSVVTLLVGVVGNYFLVPQHGYYGVVLSNLISILIGFLFCLFTFKRLTNSLFLDVFIVRMSDLKLLFSRMKNL